MSVGGRGRCRLHASELAMEETLTTDQGFPYLDQHCKKDELFQNSFFFFFFFLSRDST
jgi:hypothetical protein